MLATISCTSGVKPTIKYVLDPVVTVIGDFSDTGTGRYTFTNADVLSSSDPGCPTSLSGKASVGRISPPYPSSGTISFGVGGLTVGKSYAIRFNVGVQIGGNYASPPSFGVQFFGTNLWTFPPDTNKFTEIETNTVTATNTSTTLSFNAGSGQYTVYLLIDNIRLVENSSGRTYLLPTTATECLVKGGNFSIFGSTTTSLAITGRIANWNFSSGSGIASKDWTSCPTSSTGNAYVGMIKAAYPNHGSITVTVYDTTIGRNYYLQLYGSSLAGTGNDISSALIIKAASTTIYSETPGSRTFGLIKTASYAAVATNITFTFQLNNVFGKNCYYLIDNIKLLW